MRSTRWVATVVVLAALAACSGGEEPGATDARVAGSVEAGGLEAPTDPQAAADASESTASGQFQAGTHYQRLSPTQPTSSGPEQVEVAELFWYGCPHCFSFEPTLQRWAESRPEYVSFVRIPAVWDPLVELHARAFYTAAALGKGEEMHDAFFAEIHERGNTLDTKEAVAEFFGRFGIDAEAFDEAFESFDVHSQVQRANELARRYRVSSVPSLVVNGKYTSNAEMAGGNEQLLTLVDELAASEHPATSD